MSDRLTVRPRYWSLRNNALFEGDPIWIAQVPREWQSADQVAAMVVLNARWAGDDLARGGER
jgi:hypothetical protein